MQIQNLSIYLNSYKNNSVFVVFSIVRILELFTRKVSIFLKK